jgi:hypothetical protein
MSEVNLYKTVGSMMMMMMMMMMMVSDSFIPSMFSHILKRWRCTHCSTENFRKQQKREERRLKQWTKNKSRDVSQRPGNA